MIRHEGDLDATVARVRSCAPDHVVPGFESGVGLADHVAEALLLPGNGTGLTEARTAKSCMSEVVRAAGLDTPKQYVAEDAETLVERVSTRLGWPVIVKPDASIASDGVARCASPEEVRAAALDILGRPNAFGRRNRRVLAQQFLEGTEYVVDTVSWGGKHKPTAFWRYHRPADGVDFVCYDAMQMVPFDGERPEALARVAARALDALGVVHGPAHCEIMWTASGPVFIELGARLTAGVNATLGRLCASTCQLTSCCSCCSSRSGS